MDQSCGALSLVAPSQKQRMKQRCYPPSLSQLPTPPTSSCSIPHFKFAMLPSPLSSGHAAGRITKDDTIVVAHSHATDAPPNIDFEKVGGFVHVAAAGVHDFHRQIPSVVDVLMSALDGMRVGGIL